MKKLLLATDLSLRSDRALRRALAMAARPGVELTILHVVDSEPDEPGHEAALAAARRTLTEQVEAAAPDAARGEDYELAVTHGRAFAGILRVALEWDADLIVMGYQRDEPFRELFLGSTIDRVLKVGTTPVLIVKRASTRAYRRALVGVDFSLPARYAAEAALALTAEDAEVRLAHAYEVVLPALAGSLGSGPVDRYDQAFERQARVDLDAFVSRLPPDGRLTRDVYRGSPAETLLAAAGGMDAELLAFGTHGRGWLKSAFLGNTAARLVRAAECDLLAVRAPTPHTD